MTQATRRIAVLLLSTVAVACGGGGGGGGDDGATQLREALQGAWTTGCVLSGTNHVKATTTFDGLQGLATSELYGASDETCTTIIMSGEDSFTIAIGDAVTATLGSSTVTAREFDTITEDGTVYSIVYVDTASTPHRFHTGALDADPEKDGESPSRRPTRLSLTYAEKQ